MANGVYKNAFWEADFVTQTGFETLNSHMKDGQKSCKWLEEYLKQRAKAEEEYSKALYKISRVPIGEFGSLRKTLEKLSVETDEEHKLHSVVAIKLHEQSTKLAEFRERQKEERKKNEESAHKAHKNKADQHRKMTSSRSTYETRFRAAEKSESDAEKLKFGTKPKEAEKARARANQNRAAALKADEEYQISISNLELARANWEREHATCCDTFQNMEEERIETMRNMVWIFSNLVSDLCCQLDDSCENIRLVAEKCSQEADIRDYAKEKSTCIYPLQKITYQPCGPNGVPTSNHSPSSSRADLINQSLPSFPNGSASNNPNHIYEVGEEPNIIFTAAYEYAPRSGDEMELYEGDRIKKISADNPGWMKGYNLRSKETGLVPMNYLKND